MCFNRERCSYDTRGGGGETRRGSQSAATSAGDAISPSVHTGVQVIRPSSQPISSLNIHTSVSCVIRPLSHPSTNRFFHPPCPLSCAGTFVFHLSVKPSSLLSLLNTNKAINTTLQYTDCHHHLMLPHSQLLILYTTVLVLPFHHISSYIIYVPHHHPLFLCRLTPISSSAGCRR